MQRHTLDIGKVQASWIDFHGSGDPAHFYHANGFPPGVYRPFLRRLLPRLRVVGLEMRPLWPEIGQPRRSLDWHTYADDLIQFLESRGSTPVIGIGHSMGATATVYAAQKRPDLFKAVVLIEPAMVGRMLATAVKWLPYTFAQRGGPAKNTLKKPYRWPSRDAFLQSYRGSPMFRRLDEETWRAMSEYAIRETPTGEVELVFDREWEAHNYCKPPYALKSLAVLRVPVIAIRGKPSVFLTDRVWNQWQVLSPQTKFHALPEFGHLLPLEAPQTCANLVLSQLT